LGQREVNIRGADEDEEEEDLVEVWDRPFVTTMKEKDTTRETSQIRHVFHVVIVLILYSF